MRRTAIFISLVAPDDLRRAQAIFWNAHPIPRSCRFGDSLRRQDNIDVAVSTRRGLSGLCLSPEKMQRGRAAESAGALVIGKTNLDQFATGLAAPLALWRTPFGVSCGVCVGRIELRFGGRVAPVSFPLHSHRHGWLARVPAAFNNIAGIKPTPAVE